MALLLLGAALGTGASARPASALDAQEQAFLGLINDYRAANGLGPLALNSQLTQVALWMSQDMAGHNYFSHTDSLGRDPFQRMADLGYTYNTWRGENLAAGVETAQAALDLFKSSPEHNWIMLYGNFKVIGIARAYAPGTTFGWYWATEFGGQGEPPPPANPPAPQPPAAEAAQPAPATQTPAPPPVSMVSPASPPPPAQPGPQSVQDAATAPAPSPAPTPPASAQSEPREASPRPPTWREIASFLRPAWQQLMALDWQGTLLNRLSRIAERYLAFTTGAFVREKLPPPGITLGVPFPGQL